MPVALTIVRIKPMGITRRSATERSCDKSDESWLAVSTPVQNLTVPPGENLTDRRGDEPQVVATS
jgi:hypothetical protein